MSDRFRASAWKGGTYGIRVPPGERDRYFDPSWTMVKLELVADGGTTMVRVPLSASFWRTCSEVRHQAIGRWLRDQGLAPWPKGHPPALLVEATSDAAFRVSVEPRSEPW